MRLVTDEKFIESDKDYIGNLQDTVHATTEKQEGLIWARDSSLSCLFG